MARSTYIYVVKPVWSAMPAAVFTVKCEAYEWVARSDWDLDNIDLYRFKDNDREATLSASWSHLPWDRDEIRERRIELNWKGCNE